MPVYTGTTQDENGGAAVGAELGRFWCREPDVKTEPATRRHHTLLPQFAGSTRGKVSVERAACRPPAAGWRGVMEVVHARCCGIDVHKKTAVACVLTPAGQQTRSFGTTTRELRTLADW